MTRENKVALVVGFALVLFVGILVSDHLSKAQTQRSANLAPVINTHTTAAGPPARFVDLQTTLPSRPSRPVPLNPQPISAKPAPAPTQAAPVKEAVVATPASSERTHEVRPGESLSTICQQEYGTAALTAALAAHNGISDPDTVWAGRRLSLPAANVLTSGADIVAGNVETPARWGAYRIKEGDSLSQIARQFMGSADRWRQLYELNRHAIGDPDRIRAGTVLKVPSS